MDEKRGRGNPIGNLYSNMPQEKSELELLSDRYKAIKEDALKVNSFKDIDATKVIVRMVEIDREQLIKQLLSTSPNDIAQQGYVRGQINQIDNILFILGFK